MESLDSTNISFYEIFFSMADSAVDNFEKNKVNDSTILSFYNKIKREISHMDRDKIFEENLISLCSRLNPTENTLLFNNIVIPYYEAFCEHEQNKEVQGCAPLYRGVWVTVIISNAIIEMLCDYLDYEYNWKKGINEVKAVNNK